MSARQRRRLLPSTRIVEEVAGECRTPVFEHTLERAARDLRRHVFFEGKRQAEAINGGANHHVRVVNDQRSAHVNDEGFAILLEFPAVRSRRAAT